MLEVFGDCVGVVGLAPAVFWGLDMAELDVILKKYWEQYNLRINHDRLMARKIMWAALIGPRLVHAKGFKVPTEKELIPVPELDGKDSDQAKSRRERYTEEEMQEITAATQEQMEYLDTKEKVTVVIGKDKMTPEQQALFAKALFTPGQ